MRGRGNECLPVDARHRAGRVVETLLAREPDRAFDEECALQREDRSAEHRGGRHRVTPDRIADLPCVKQQREQQVQADGRVPHALPRIEPALQAARREFREHRHRDREVDPVRHPDEEAASENRVEIRCEYHQQRTDHRQQLRGDQWPHAPPPVGHPAADRVERDRDPRRKRRHPRDLRGRQMQFVRHRPEAGAQCRVGKCVEKQPAERQPPDESRPARDTGARVEKGDDVFNAMKLDRDRLHNRPPYICSVRGSTLQMRSTHGETILQIVSYLDLPGQFTATDAGMSSASGCATQRL